MITAHQPTIFPSNVTVRLSSVSDGTVTLISLPEDPDEVWRNRKDIIDAAGGDIDTTALVYIIYEGNDYLRYHEATEYDMPLATNQPADALVTTTPGVGLFLPIADCCAVVLYDPTRKVLMLSHIGRHAALQYGGQKSVEYLVGNYNTNPSDVVVWLSPAVGKDEYPVFGRDNRGLKELILEDLLKAGVQQQNVEISPIDTAQDTRYFSHSQYIKGNRTTLDGRFAVYVRMQK